MNSLANNLAAALERQGAAISRLDDLTRTHEAVLKLFLAWNAALTLYVFFLLWKSGRKAKA